MNIIPFHVWRVIHFFKRISHDVIYIAYVHKVFVFVFFQFLTYKVNGVLGSVTGSDVTTTSDDGKRSIRKASGNSS